MSETQLLEQLDSIKRDDVKLDKVSLVIRFEGNGNLLSKKDDDFYDAHTGGMSGGGSSIQHCTPPW
ncbi:MAG: hypothetical protein M3029_02040 [Lactobacillus helsingborgensis]|uniref:hypothetical protein n=1 Tax=Lactobacillus TaxID=1578 RepID=UPI00050D2750|nr:MULTISPECIES: hypothetical protein [Lactobacillus]MCT6888652.1 hypothetical protein [Lactobacillus sp.]MEB3364974.1 hypothetical protein [Lactobacillus sp. R2/2]AIS09551.1 hypothetical protein LACWKB8_1293 [Lactobacillus sp. wkB8]AWN33780.1 hypothetical protein DLD54_06230 [Lactobacillus helsingborgensis]MCT6811908.1 hypothetical protein [Lactobacillus helsingborgensis]